MHRLQTSQRGRSFPMRCEYSFHSDGGTAATVLTAIRTSRRVARSSVSRPEWSIPRPSRSPIPAPKRPSIGRVTRPGAAAERSGRMQIAWPSATTRCTQFSLSVRKRGDRADFDKMYARLHPESSRTNADDRLPPASLGRVEGGDGVVEGRDVADVHPQSSVPHPLDDLTQLGTIGLDNEVDRQAVGGPCLGRTDDGHQCSSSSNQACGPLLDVTADGIEHQIDAADVFQRVVVEVNELLRAEVEHFLTVGRASGADDVSAELTRELRHHRPDCACRAVREDALPRLKVADLE